jgi:hypothetical protein
MPWGHESRRPWTDGEGIEWSKEFMTERDTVTHLVEQVPEGLRFHDLRQLVRRGSCRAVCR